MMALACGVALAVEVEGTRILCEHELMLGKSYQSCSATFSETAPTFALDSEQHHHGTQITHYTPMLAPPAPMVMSDLRTHTDLTRI